MKRGSSFVVTQKMRDKGVFNRDDLDRLCFHETNELINEYLYTKMSQERAPIERLYINPDGRRSVGRSVSGDHECWFPRAEVRRLKTALLAGGHTDGTPEYDYYKRIQANTMYRQHKRVQIKSQEAMLEDAELQSEAQLRLMCLD